jgi:hypothetical protein
VAGKSGNDPPGSGEKSISFKRRRSPTAQKCPGRNGSALNGNDNHGLGSRAWLEIDEMVGGLQATGDQNSCEDRQPLKRQSVTGLGSEGVRR